MKIKEFFRKIFLKGAKEEALQSAFKRSKALLSAQKRSKALLYEQDNRLYEQEKVLYEPKTSLYEPKSLDIERESLKLGLVAGVAGRSIREIESSLIRIETQMPTKDWIELRIRNLLEEILETIRTHERKEEERFNILKEGPSEKKSLKEKYLTPRMSEILQVLKKEGEISYEDLAKRLGLRSVSGVRAILTEMMKRTDEIERFERDGKGWVRLSAQKRSKALPSVITEDSEL